MRVPFVLFLLSLSLAGLGVSTPDLPGLDLLGVIAAAASLILLLRALIGRKGPAAKPDWVVVDGSNVMHWQDNTPSLAPVRAVIAELTAQGKTPGVVFDANAGYKIGDRFQNDRDLARQLGLPRDRVLVVPKGTPADAYILQSAHDLGARVVTNDRYRDWAEAHPEVATPGFLIRGGVRDGAVWLEG